jgi:thioredoxin 1
MSQVREINDSLFESEVLNSEKPVLVYFWAAWCGPCRLVSPSINSVAATFGDRLKVVKLEIDPNPKSVAEYKVEGVPALRLVKDQEVILNHEGAITKDKMIQMLENCLSK